MSYRTSINLTGYLDLFHYIAINPLMIFLYISHLKLVGCPLGGGKVEDVIHVFCRGRLPGPSGFVDKHSHVESPKRVLHPAAREALRESRRFQEALVGIIDFVSGP